MGCDAVRWQGETTLRARARKEEQRRQRAVAQLNRVRSARHELDLALEAEKWRIHVVFLEAKERPGEISGLNPPLFKASACGPGFHNGTHETRYGRTMGRSQPSPDARQRNRLKD